ncbi:MAG: glycosyl transferase, group 1 [uncultured Chloroflexi bacterium]|uniref:Glycosyl transferase, group 1 n=1 Tax=uncultured Chloroflexota bacterium TaxID=166587 RepID=A0A6J4HPH5_9CHLR|nr:MAG: glycosyl transferase, group 1 [uncultured Chloroflexota bacterium]
MRIGLITGEFPPAIGGVGDHTARLARELTVAGHEVEVLTSATGEGLAANAGAAGATAGGSSSGEGRGSQPPVLRQVRRWDGRILVRVPALAGERGWDIVHIQYQPAAYGLHGAINLLPLAIRLGYGRLRRSTLPAPRAAVVTTFHDLRVPYLFPKAGPLRTLAVRILARFSDATIAVAEDDLPQLKRWRPRAPAPATRHVPLGNQLDAAPLAGCDSHSLRRRFGLHPEKPVIGYLGFVNRSKGVLELIQAVSGLVRDGVDLQLLMIGEQLGTADPTNRAYHAEVQARIAALALADRVRWTGYLPEAEITGSVRMVDVMALPFLDGASQRRTSLIAALAQGVPVVTTGAVGGVRAAAWLRTPEGEDGALLVPRGDAAALGHALALLLRDDERRAAFGAAGRAVSGRFAWPAVVDQTVSVYQAALAASDG